MLNRAESTLHRHQNEETERNRKMNLISIIVPVYNVERYLDECVKSIIGQTYQNIEVILVDDGSTDHSAAICDRWAEVDDRIRVIHKPNGGLSDARNCGLETAKGEYIYFIDSDDYIDHSLCEKAMDVFKTENVDLVVFGVARTTETGDIISTDFVEKCFLSKKAALAELYSGQIKNYAVNKVYKRELWNKVRFPLGRAFEDIGTMYKVFLNAQTICCIPDILYYYRMRQGSIVATMSPYTLRDMFYMRKQSYDDMITVYPDVAELCFERLSLGAKAYLDRSFWHNPDSASLAGAIDFLQENKEKIRRIGNWELRFYLRYPTFYRIYRLLKHKVGNIVKKLRHKLVFEKMIHR